MSNEELVELYQNGDKQVLEAIIEQNRGIIYWITNKFYVEGINAIDREDLEQEGIIGLITAVKRYDFNNEKKAQFITYAIYWIYQRINRFVKTRCTNEEISLNNPVSDDGDTELVDYIKYIDYSFENVEEKIYRLQLRKELESVMNEYLTLKEREIIKLHFGWDNNKPMSLEEIGEIFKVTRERIRQLKDRSFRRLRYSKWGRLKAVEIYKYKKNQTMYSIPGTIESISFAERYL